MKQSILQIAGYKNSGKTTLVERLTRELTERGYRVGTVKHDAHQFEIDLEGTDTWRHRQSGARMTAITSAGRTALMMEKHTPLDALLRQMADMDIVIVEGFKQEPYPKIVIVRSREDALLLTQLKQVIAVCAWGTPPACGVPTFTLEEMDKLASWAAEELMHRLSSRN